MESGRGMIAELARHRVAVATGARARFGGDASVRAVALLVARDRGLALDDLLLPSRGRAPVAAARQLAMYLTHVMLGRTLTEVGALFGRDRTTVAHACALIEDGRDEAATDSAIGRLEAAIAGFATPDREADRAAG